VDYRRRTVDAELDELLGALPAVALEGAKAVGKTATALRRATTVHRLDDPAELAVARAEPARLVAGTAPVLIDEWQRLPETWDLVRRAVDDGAPAGSFLITGSLTPAHAPTHSGAGRIVTIRMRPMTLEERGVAEPSVSLAALLSGDRPEVTGTTDVVVGDYAREIAQSGFPGLRGLQGRPLRAQLDGYVDRIVTHDFEEAGHPLVDPEGLRRWMTAYAAASSTTASLETIRDAATSGQGEKPAKTTTIAYRNVLERLWILDPVPGWRPTRSPLGRLAVAPKHQLVDPAIALRLLGADEHALLDAAAVPAVVRGDGVLLGALFESLATLCVRVAGQHSEARVFHLRQHSGRREVDLIVERADHRVVAIEVKLTRVPSPEDGKHLRWLRDQIGDELLDAVIVTTGSSAYRDRDGFAVVPLALLGP
jgi:predicted AAA+ superfamily ATPase